jgi:hypothetical protein
VGGRDGEKKTTEDGRKNMKDQKEGEVEGRGGSSR